MKTGFTTLVLSASLLAAGAAQAQARHYDCTKAGNANKAVCKGSAASPTPTPSAVPMPKSATTPPPSASATTKHYDCSKAGNANKAVCKGTAQTLSAAAPAPAITAQTARPSPVPKAPAIRTSAAAPMQTPSGSPRIVAWTEKNGKMVHYDCSKAGNFNKKACKQ